MRQEALIWCARLGLCVGLTSHCALAWAIDDFPQHQVIVGSPDTGYYWS
jgi:hypothetical protein